MRKVVVTTALSAGSGPHFDLLRKEGFEVVDIRRDVDIFKPEIRLSEVKDCVAVIAGSEPWNEWILTQCPKLRVLARTGVGYDAIDLPACDRHRVVVATTPGVNHHAVAEHSIAMLMAVARLFPARDHYVRDCTWKRSSSPRIMGRTIGLMGLGRIGRAVATRAVGLGMKVIAYEPFPQKEFCEQWNVELTSFDDLLKRSDYVSLHLPMSAETRHVMNAKTFAMMKPGSILINTARGLLVDENALIDALKSGHLRGAGLDVFEVEPLPKTSPLLQMDNVLLSGHLAGLDDESQRDTLTMTAEIIISLYKGGWPTECIRNLEGVKDWKWSDKD